MKIVNRKCILFCKKLKHIIVCSSNFIKRDIALSRHKVTFAVLALLIIGIALRCSCLVIRDRHPRDEQFYIETVERMMKNDDSWKTYYRVYGNAPLVIIIAANVAKVGFEAESTLRTLNIIYSILWLLVMLFLCYEIFNNSIISLLGMMLAVFNPYSIRMSCLILREPLYILIFTISVWVAVRFIKSEGENSVYPILLAVLTFIGFFTRLEGIEIGAFLPLAVIVILMQYKWQRLKRCIYSLSVYVIFIILICSLLIKFDNIYLCNADHKVLEYLNLIAGKWL